MLDVLATQVSQYSTGRSASGIYVQDPIIRQLCAGDRPFDGSAVPSAELYFITAEKSIRVLVGPNWVSDGTIQAPLTQAQYDGMMKVLTRQRLQEVGPAGNTAREVFDRRMATKYYNRITADEEAQRRSGNERGRAQQGLPMYCKE